MKSYYLLGLAILPWCFTNCASVKPTASVPEAQARQTALEAVHGGTVKESELEREGGHDVWSFDIAQPGLKGVKEVTVDAHSGKVLEISLETEEQEKHEAAQLSAPRADQMFPRSSHLGLHRMR